MTDERPSYAEDDSDTPAEGAHKERDRRGLNAAMGVTIAVVIIVLALMMLRGCSSILSSANRQSSTNQIVPVEGARPVDGKVSVWVVAGTNLQDALSAAGVDASGIVDMGGGRFVITVPAGREVDAVRSLQSVKGLYDAGRVYEGDGAK
jgi:uncharacterized protein YceK